MHPRNFGFERIVCTYYDVQKSVLHVQIRPFDLSITYNQPRVTSGYERFAWVFGTFDKITLRFAMNMLFWFCPGIHRIHKWRTCGKKLVRSHESEALEDKQKLQMKTFSELAACLAGIPPKITLYGRLFQYNDVGCLLLLMFSTDLLFAIKRDAYIFKETGLFCRFPTHQKLDKWAMAGEKRQTCWPKLHTETEYESQLIAIL